MSPFVRSAVRPTAMATGVILLCALLAGVVGAPLASAKSHEPQVLYVGAFDGITTPSASTFSTVQGAVNAATKGDWILIGPGDYHETSDMGVSAPTSAEVADGWYGGVDITTPDIHLRGMNRNTVIVDGTQASSPACSPAPSDQNSLGGLGRNGIVVWKAKGVSIDNLTVCNFIAGTGQWGERDLVERWRRIGQARTKGLLRQLSHSHLDLLCQQ